MLHWQTKFWNIFNQCNIRFSVYSMYVLYVFNMHIQCIYLRYVIYVFDVCI